MGQAVDWFEEWFDSPYYHVLYRHRDNEEAERFLDLLIEQIPFRKGSSVLDIACGKGRHAIHLQECGFDVTGFDLSEKSISHNLSYANDRLNFYRHDMRQVFRVNYFDYVINLFSSFGYFDNDHENLQAMRSSVTALRPGGTFIFDYANSQLIRTSLVTESDEHADGIHFQIRKRIEEPFVVKEIELTDNGIRHRYCERLRLFSPSTLTGLMERCGLSIRSLHGDYELGPFLEDRSPRLIVVAEKK